jgi:hypothetical protein
MGNSSGYISLAIIGGLMAAVIAGGLYFASGDKNIPAPTGMRAYAQENQMYFGGRRKTGRRKKHGRKTRKL